MSRKKTKATKHTSKTGNLFVFSLFVDMRSIDMLSRKPLLTGQMQVFFIFLQSLHTNFCIMFKRQTDIQL